MYTAAEARRIDIERGGEGRIRYQQEDNNSRYLFFDEKSQTWRISQEVGNQRQFAFFDLPSTLIHKKWLPVTPEREDDVEHPEFYINDDEVKELIKKADKLEAENAELKERLRWKCCESEKPEKNTEIFYKRKGIGEWTVGLYIVEKDMYFFKSGYSIVCVSDLANWQWREV
jgi:hypothetical protein